MTESHGNVHTRTVPDPVYTYTTDDAMLYCCCRHSRSRYEARVHIVGTHLCDHPPPHPQHPLRKHNIIPVARGTASSHR